LFPSFYDLYKERQQQDVCHVQMDNIAVRHVLSGDREMPAKVHKAPEKAGVKLIPENSGGVGVRLKKRQKRRKR